jgi:inhibitor of KinA
MESPGGWQILGRTPVKLFNPEREPPVLLQMGDLVQFFPVSEKEFKEWT